ncbi:MAG: aldo/keto reductase [Anaerolineae bacterium]|nr:aldo/keto reductase [Anaerolineae bacterium]
MDKRRLGRTNHLSTTVIFGAAAFWDIDQESAHKAMNLVLERGVNHIDIAPGYNKAEERLGHWLEPRRDLFFLGCKTGERRRDDAWKNLHRSLKRLYTDYFDLYQLHAICTLDELDRVFAPDGAMKTLVEARGQGLTRYLGITSHGMDAPAVQLAALDRFDFDTVMFPLNARLYADPDYRRSAERLLDVCAQRDVGVMIIKAIAKAPWGDRPKTYGPWYEPFDTPDDIARGVRFALSQPVTCLASSADVRLLPLLFQAADDFTPMSADEQAAAIAQDADAELIFHGPEMKTPD